MLGETAPLPYNGAMFFLCPQLDIVLRRDSCPTCYWKVIQSKQKLNISEMEKTSLREYVYRYANTFPMDLLSSYFLVMVFSFLPSPVRMPDK